MRQKVVNKRFSNVVGVTAAVVVVVAAVGGVIYIVDNSNKNGQRT